MTVVEHLTELRRRIVVSLIAVTLGAIVCFIFSASIISFFVTYYREATQGQKNSLIFLGPLDAFLTRIKIATYGGIVLALPVWLWELWRFITPGLNPKEKRYAIPFVTASVILFAGGSVVAVITFPKALSFLLGVGGNDLTPLLTAGSYLTLVFLMILAFGISFEFPILMMFLLLARILTTQQLRQVRKYA